MLYDEELARMRAQMLAKEEEEPPVFDDGARFLRQDPNMMQVGLFGRPKKPAAPPTAPPVNLQRRSILGLTPMPADLPAVIPPSAPRPTPQQIEQAVPQQQPTSAPSSAPSASPLQSLADKALNTPMSRRDVLQRAGQAALQQVVPMPSVTDVVPQVMSPLAEVAKAVPAFDKNAIISAVSSFLTDKMVDTSSDLAAELYDRGIWEPEDPNAADATTAWEYAQYGDEDHPEGLATLHDNFTLQKLSEHSGIPIEELKKHISDAELQGFPLSIGSNQERLSAIMEDGRPKEAYRMTAFEDLGPIDDYIRKSATELYGTQKSFDDDERWEIVNHAQGLVYDDYVRKTINDIEMTEYGFYDEVLLKAGKDWLDEAFSSVFDQGLEYSGYTHDDFYAHLDNALKPKRAPKPKVVKPKSKSKDK